MAKTARFVPDDCIAPRKGDLSSALTELDSRVVLTGIGFTPHTSLRCVSASEMPAALNPRQVYRAIIADFSDFELRWQKQKDSEDFTMGKWSFGHSHDRWGARRECEMKVKTGPFGYQQYREVHQFLYVTDENGSKSLLFCRSGKMPRPPALVPSFTCNCAYLFTWPHDGEPHWKTHFGITGYNGLLRKRVEMECRLELARFEDFLKNALVDASSDIASTPTRLSAQGRRGSQRSMRSGCSSFRTCISFDDTDAPATPANDLHDSFTTVPDDSELAEMPIGALADLAVQLRVVKAEDVADFRQRLISGMSAPSSKQATSTTASSSPSVGTPMSKEAADESTPLSRECLEKLAPRDLLDASDALSGANAVSSDVSGFRSKLLCELRKERDASAVRAQSPTSQRAIAKPPQRKSRGWGCCCSS